MYATLRRNAPDAQETRHTASACAVTNSPHGIRTNQLASSGARLIRDAPLKTEGEGLHTAVLRLLCNRRALAGSIEKKASEGSWQGSFYAISSRHIAKTNQGQTHESRGPLAHPTLCGAAPPVRDRSGTFASPSLTTQTVHSWQRKKNEGVQV